MRDVLLLAFVLVCLIVALRYPFVGVLTWAWFALMTPHQLAYGVFGVPLNVLIAGATLVAIAFNGSYKAFVFDRITGLLIALAFWLWVSQIFSLDPLNSNEYFDRFVKQLVFVLLCVQMTTDRLRFHALLWMLVIGVGYFALKGSIFTLGTFGQFRVQGLEKTILEDNNHMGIAIATVLPMILYLREQASRPMVKLGLLGLFGAAMVAVIGTQSRGAFVSLLVFAGFFWLRSRHKFTLLVALMLVLAPAIAFMPSKWSERMSTITDASEDASFMGRVDAWVINTKLALKYPLTGAGLRNPYQIEIAKTVDVERAPRAKAAHSIYFEILGGTGFVGLAIYLSLLATAFLTALSLHLRRNDPKIEPWMANFGYYSQMSLVVFGVGGATVSLEMWDGYFIIIALTAALAKMAKHASPVEKTQRIRKFSWRVAARGRSLPKPEPGSPSQS